MGLEIASKLGILLSFDKKSIHKTKQRYSLLEILYYVAIQFATTCNYLSFATMFYHFYNYLPYF
jgi:hypothetical protein